MKHLTTPLVLAALLTLPAMAHAQSASIQASANVVAQLTVTQGNNLDFGDVLPGFGAQVDISENPASAGTFTLSGASGYEVNLSFDLPSVLTNGTNQLTISFGADDAGYGPNGSTVTQTFDPAVGADTNLGGTEMTVFIGGSVNATADQAPGEYTGTIQLNVEYTGN